LLKKTPFLELDLGARVEEAADILVRIAAGGAEQVERRIAVERVVDARIEAEALRRVEPDPEVMIVDVRVVDLRERVGVRRRTTVERILGFELGRDRRAADEAELILEVPLAEVEADGRLAAQVGSPSSLS
jgi:hypothetical protein